MESTDDVLEYIKLRYGDLAYWKTPDKITTTDMCFVWDSLTEIINKLSPVVDQIQGLTACRIDSK